MNGKYSGSNDSQWSTRQEYWYGIASFSRIFHGIVSVSFEFSTRHQLWQELMTRDCETDRRKWSWISTPTGLLISDSDSQRRHWYYPQIPSLYVVHEVHESKTFLLLSKWNRIGYRICVSDKNININIDNVHFLKVVPSKWPSCDEYGDLFYTMLILSSKMMIIGRHLTSIFKAIISTISWRIRWL